MKKILVAVLNYNGLHHLQKFLPSVAAHSSNAEILLIDNASTDGSVEWIQKNYSHIRTVRLDKNYGYAGAYTRILMKEDADYFVILNNDVEVTPGWIEKMRAVLEENDKVAAVQPKLLQYDKRTVFEYSGACGGHLDALGYPFCRGRIFDTSEEDKHQYDTPSEIFWTCGAAMMIRADVFKKAGGFDETFFTHQEEIDLCWRIQRLGYKLKNVPDVTVFHLGGGTLAEGSDKKIFYNFRNSLFNLIKNYPTGKVWIIVLMRLMLDGIYALRMIFAGKWKVPFIILKSHVSFYVSLPSLLKKRKELTSYLKFDIYPDYKGSVVWQYFVRRKRRFQEIYSAKT